MTPKTLTVSRMFDSLNWHEIYTVRTEGDYTGSMIYGSDLTGKPKVVPQEQPDAIPRATAMFEEILKKVFQRLEGRTLVFGTVSTDGSGFLCRPSGLVINQRVALYITEVFPKFIIGETTDGEKVTLTAKDPFRKSWFLGDPVIVFSGVDMVTTVVYFSKRTTMVWAMEQFLKSRKLPFVADIVKHILSWVP